MNLKELRLQSKKTATEVAGVLGVTSNAVSNYENGIRSINIGQVLKLSEVYDVSAEDIIKSQLTSINICSAKNVVC